MPVRWRSLRTASAWARLKLRLQGIILPVERLAVIDMGSNSWRLVVFGYESGTPWWSLVDEIREAVRIGAGVDETGVLRPDRVDRALHTAAVFSAFCQATGVEEVVAVATSAIRDASNGEEVLEQIRRTTGLEPRVISGHEEARYGWLAIANSTTIEDGFGLDIGGGSIQALRIEGRRLADAESRPLGAVRMSERFLPGERASAKQMKALRGHVADELQQLGWWSGGGHIVGIGGTIRNLAAAAMKRLTIPDIDVQGFQLTRDALEGLIEELAERPASKRAQLKGIKYDRSDVILGGALVLATAMEEGGFDSIEVTEAGLREGVFFEHLLGERELFEDVRAESVRNLAHRFEHHGEHDLHVWTLSRSMFDGLAAAGLHELGDKERELLWAGCLLHDIGVAVNYDDHHRHSHYLTLNAGLPGFAPRELILIGLVARYHRKGAPDASELGDLAEAGDDNRLRLLCGVIRLAEQLERSRDQAITDVRVSASDGKVALAAATDPALDSTVPIWAARRNADLLAEALGRDVEISA
jgi:exopolyphosphatase / guanosine-5'-triphosphate,3'-diphosphate pyrophosphatase